MTPIARFFALGASTAGTAIGGVIQGVRMVAMRFISRTSWGISWLLGRTRIDYARWVDPMRNSIVVAVVRWVARNFPESPVRIRRLNPDGTSLTIGPSKSGPGFMLRLLERPNPYYSGVLQWIATIVDLFVTGNGYWIKIRDTNPGSLYFDRPVELWWIPKKLMRPAWPADGTVFISHYLYRVDGVDYRIANRDVVHFRDSLNPDNVREGMSALGSLLGEIYTDDEAANFSAQLLTNLGVPGVIISPSNTNPNVVVDTETVKKKYEETFSGDGRGKPMVLSGPADIKVLSWSPEQMNLKALRRLPEERISAVLGVPAGVAQLGAGLDRNTFTNYSEARRAAFQEAIAPLMRLIAAELETQLLSDFADLDAESLDVDFDTSKASALQEAVDSVWRRTESAATKGLLTRAAFKRAIGEPVDEQDDDVYVVPNNYTFVPPGGAPAPSGGRPPASALAPVEPAAADRNGNGHHDPIGVAA